MRSILLVFLAVCGASIAAAPTSNLCEDIAVRFNDFSPRSAWRLDTAYFVETSPGETPNDWSWKYQYSATTGYPTSITVDFFEGAGPKLHAFVPMEGGFYIQSSDSGFEYSVFQSEADSFVHTMWTTQNGKIVDSTRVSSWDHGQFGLRYQGGFVDTIRSFWSGDTFFDMEIPSKARNTATFTYLPSIDTCLTPSQDQGLIRKGSYSESIVRTAWNDGFKITSSKLDSTYGNYRTTRIYRPLSAVTTVKRQARTNHPLGPAEPVRWNGSHPRESAISTNPIEQLRHGQIPTNTAVR